MNIQVTKHQHAHARGLELSVEVSRRPGHHIEARHSLDYAYLAQLGDRVETGVQEHFGRLVAKCVMEAL